MDFLNNLWSYALPKAKAEAAELQKLMDKEGKGEKLEAWDWWYYTEKLRKEKYNLEEEEIKPYFKLENVREGAFAVANKLYGITLTKLEGIPVYHPDVEVFEVKAADGSQVGIFYVDYFPRPGKSGGAWMSNYREQQGSIRPLVCNVCSFTKPVGDTPSLLTIDEVETLFHEFGHALHGLLTQCQYKGTSGTNVVRDFVELPSQINEHWATEPEVLKMYAKHYKTGEVIPDSLIEKILNQKTFNQGFMTTELLAAAILDMNLHNLTDTEVLMSLHTKKKRWTNWADSGNSSPLPYHILQPHHRRLCCRLLQLSLGQCSGQRCLRSFQGTRYLRQADSRPLPPECSGKRRQRRPDDSL